MKKNIQQIATTQSTLSPNEQENIKGGLLIYCEEKRIKLLGKETTVTQWKMKPNGSLLVSVKM